ncbi:hypothetical protein [Croceicoccus marinus]|jgi:hypothetical protein|uniref:Uncharacterized protein n=1 Tax=Croceicoccus marinus TaxID=450378 RepID=A0A7G6VR50_9SPHN|nr:hypothetical protein [Croceicoccus marinus]QNE04215.1 hypothetical protein H4O24_09415 [Croceicoccus marinus]
MMVAALAVPALLTSACGEERDPAQEAADVAEIRAMHDNPPAVPVDPQRISYSDIEKNDLFGAGCGFAPENSLSVIALAQPERGFLKLDGEILTLSPDKGGASLPMDSWQNYSGSDYAFELTRTSETGEESGMEATSWPGSLRISDRQGKTVYEAGGTLQCGA